MDYYDAANLSDEDCERLYACISDSIEMERRRRLVEEAALQLAHSGWHQTLAEIQALPEP